MLVDDQADTLNLTKAGLEEHGFIVDAFDDPGKALMHFRQDSYDRILLDIALPRISGFELARQIWQIDNNAGICFFSRVEIFEDEARKAFSSHSKEYCFLKKTIISSKIVNHLKRHLVVS
jgi:two-component system copper resistance phosphate regulon response regulator CusR